MIDDIVNIINEFEGLKIVSGLIMRRTKDRRNEKGVLVKKGEVFFDYDLEFEGKRFLVTFVPANNIRAELMKCLEQNIVRILKESDESR